ncbi:copper homeostasis protein CutC [Porphyromonas cangingivalis]|uniref:PF03932 family protein CutC n=1 Tax=Porphyromonas cangingivalis TaxID=36874 RepID=A0A1T4L137_PORCN|nr:copper homeostasis protein CutC [Porphyromonas cangingivalis]SJZ48419.1 copper homeostasis protein [Porphyromonas cangingivalis]VEJ03975.1 Copper homeostasis protein CutC [Porphyromonas cangingivalis]
MDRKFTLEICANSIASCIEAERGGASRVELCAGIPEGGTTPSIGMVTCALERVSIPVFPIIRPRGGDFLYTKEEIDTMECDIRMFVDLGVPGVVIGALTAEGRIDKEVCARLIEAAQGRQVTLHRAFDMARDLDEALEDAIALGFDRILTSGGAPTAHEGLSTIRHLVDKSAGRISIMPGCGIGVSNIARIALESGASEFHGSLRTDIPSQMLYRNPHVSMGGTVTIDEYSTTQTDAKIVKEVVRILSTTSK